MDEDQAILGMLHLWAGSRWWEASEVVSSLGVADLPECVSEAKRPAVSFGRWLAHRRGKTIGPWRLEAKGRASSETMRWRVVSELDALL